MFKTIKSYSIRRPLIACIKSNKNQLISKKKINSLFVKSNNIDTYFSIIFYFKGKTTNNVVKKNKILLLSFSFILYNFLFFFFLIILFNFCFYFFNFFFLYKNINLSMYTYFFFKKNFLILKFFFI